MTKDLNNATISCPLFKRHQEILVSKTSSIKNSVRPIEKSIFAEEISDTADNMLNCTNYDKHQIDCNTCHAIATMQKKLAEVHFDVRKSA